MKPEGKQIAGWKKEIEAIRVTVSSNVKLDRTLALLRALRSAALQAGTEKRSDDEIVRARLISGALQVAPFEVPVSALQELKEMVNRWVGGRWTKELCASAAMELEAIASGIEADTRCIADLTVKIDSSSRSNEVQTRYLDLLDGLAGSSTSTN